ncbi:MAG: AAA family ATPase [Clostridia bacterium]|nr:AAA family ATPase [Clostridia bacterium]
MPDIDSFNGSQASERAFVGAVVNGYTRATDHGLKTSDFSDEFCKSAFSACLQLETQGKHADIVTMFDDFPDIDSGALIALTQEASFEKHLVEQHAENIRSAGQRRRIKELFLKAAQAAQDTAQPLEDVIYKTRVYLDKTAAQSATEGHVSGTDALVDFCMWLDKKEPEKAISTGLSKIDACLSGGLKGGRLYVIGARTGVGKSALMCSMATAAIKKGEKVLYISLEMGARENVARMIASVSGVSLGRINNRPTLSDGDHGAIIESCALLPGDNFRFSTRARTPEDIRRAALKMRAQTGVDMVVVDYLQLLQPDIKASSRVEAIGAITRALKLLAMELDIPVLSAAQVNRAGAQGGGAPRLSDLRESGSIEQDADVVFLMHREDGQESEECKKVDIFIAKNRQGNTGYAKFIFNGALMRFYPLQERRQAG